MTKHLIALTLIGAIVGCQDDCAVKVQRPDVSFKQDANGDLQLDFESLGLKRCARRPTPGLELCETSKEVFNVDQTTQALITLYQRLGNTRCCRTVESEGDTYEQCRTYTGSCPAGWYRD